VRLLPDRGRLEQSLQQVEVVLHATTTQASTTCSIQTTYYPVPGRAERAAPPSGRAEASSASGSATIPFYQRPTAHRLGTQEPSTSFALPGRLQPRWLTGNEGPRATKGRIPS